MAFTPESRHIIVNYHYVENPREDRRGFHPCPVDEFERQIAFLSGVYKMTTVGEVVQAAWNSFSEKRCAITFDDGLKDNFENALPILNKYAVQATFFPISKIFSDNLLPTTHKMHYLLSKLSSEELADQFNAFLSREHPHLTEKYTISKTKRLTHSRKMYDDVITANVKEMMNNLSRDHTIRIVRDRFLRDVFQKMNLDEGAMVRELFMNIEDVRTLKREKHEIGSHGHSHEALDAFSEDEIRTEILLAKKILEKEITPLVTVFAYPQSAPSVDVRHVLKNTGIKYALTTERRFVASDDDPYLIPRFDTNDIRDFLDARS